MVKVFSPGSIGNVGPGFDVLGLAVAELGDTVSMEWGENETRVNITGRDADLIPTDPSENTVTLAAQAYLAREGFRRALDVHIERALPSSGGLGASAASSVAGAMAAAALLGKEDDHQGVVEAALTAETHVAGRHLDNIAPSVYGGLTLVQSVDPIRIHQVAVGCQPTLLLVTPNIKIKTKDSRSVLPEKLIQSDWVRQMANTCTLVNGFSRGDFDMIKHGLEDGYGERYRSPLIPGFDEAKDVCMELGALGFSISGAGPTCFAFFERRDDAEKAKEPLHHVFGDCTVFIGSIAAEGAKVL
ncbi:homoserine kinase [Pseudobacteriovorax antillogorgiicola]|uniref:Homoserine kinase n=1 Tax=Pseudobacteriovorax antillogorgiicola TaxID=1513793 RepID=A0A1Y6CQN6_9BACT|nr:homoserine kinase [Pseudobacteriovorax antillogorgiicola]TCS46151.1 homoserine kinase [Pseudobacteriovorax antillogorgiicola]SMF69795.1 homoserine kinase [Pseudobacteriovorax antillogorgiicola]